MSTKRNYHYTNFVVDVKPDLVPNFLHQCTAAWRFTGEDSVHNQMSFACEFPFGSLTEKRVFRVLDALVSSHLVYSYMTEHITRTW